MFGYHLAFHYHVVYIDFNILAKLRFKHLSHHPLIGGSCIFQAEGHYLVVVVSSGSNKSCFLWSSSASGI